MNNEIDEHHEPANSSERSSSDSSKAGSSDSLNDWIASLLARAAIGFLFFFAFFVGVWISATGLHDPDTCWLLAIGKTIFETGQIPRIDPFSYTMDGRPFVPYQWFTELLFYLSYKLGAGYLLLTLVDSVIVLAFLAMTMIYHRVLRAPLLGSIGIVILGTVASSFHSLARPEVFSYLFLTILFLFMAKIRLRAEYRRTSLKKDLPKLLPIFALFVVWANMHTGFISGLVVLLTYAIALTVEAFFRKERKRMVAPASAPSGAASAAAPADSALPAPAAANLPWHQAAALFAWLVVLTALAGTLVTPFCIGLWQYIPQLFFSPINKYIIELKSITLSSLKQPTYYPYLLLFAVWLAVLVKQTRKWASQKRIPFGLLFSFLLGIEVFFYGTSYVRVIPFSSMFFVLDTAWLLKGQLRNSPSRNEGSIENRGSPEIESSSKNENSSKPVNSLFEKVNQHLSQILNVRNIPAILLLFSWLGVLLTFSRLSIPPTIPQDGVGFVTPRGAIMHLAKELPHGRVLNDPQYGDVMIWHLIEQDKPILLPDPFRVARTSDKPKVFIDTRFDMYGPQLVGDYYSIVMLEPGWKEIFDRYRFDWTFLPVNYPLVRKLKEELKWTEIYHDDRAVMLLKPI